MRISEITRDSKSPTCTPESLAAFALLRVTCQRRHGVVACSAADAVLTCGERRRWTRQGRQWPLRGRQRRRPVGRVRVRSLALHQRRRLRRVRLQLAHVLRRQEGALQLGGRRRRHAGVGQRLTQQVAASAHVRAGQIEVGEGTARIDADHQAESLWSYCPHGARR